MLKDIRVLVVDDTADMRILIAKVLKRHGATTMETDSVDNALAALEQFKPDVIISDISMPEKTGYDLVRTLRDEIEPHKEAKIPAIAVSAFTDELSKKKSLMEGFQVHLGKPFEQKRLIELVAVLAELDSEAVECGFDAEQTYGHKS